MKSIFFIILFFSLLNTGTLANTELFATADRYAQLGKFQEMLNTYNQILDHSSNNIRALNGKGTALSWLGRFTAAQQVFIEALSIEPNNVESLTGLGYAYAWDRQDRKAIQVFMNAVAIDPDNLGAQKGLGFAYLWSGQYQQSITQFSSLREQYPLDPEPHAGIGQAHLALGHSRRAKESFDKALSLEPDRDDARNGRRDAFLQKARGDLSIWYGTTSGGDSGVRLVEGSAWINKRTKVFAIYDNSLSLDNPALARDDEKAETYELGVFREFSKHWLGTASVGYRDLPNKEHQNVYKAEVARFIGANIVKLGAQVSPHSEDFTDHVYHFGFGFPVTDRWRLEPILYLSETGGTNDDEWRAVLNADYVSVDGWKLNLGAGYGDIDSAISGASGSVRVANVSATIPVGFHRLHFTARREESPTNDFTVLMVGFTFRFPQI